MLSSGKHLEASASHEGLPIQAARLGVLGRAAFKGFQKQGSHFGINVLYLQAHRSPMEQVWPGVPRRTITELLAQNHMTMICQKDSQASHGFGETGF